MAWDDDKSSGDVLLSQDWDDMVSDQKGHASRHESGGADALTFSNLADVGITSITADTSSNLPAAGTSGRLFFETDTGRTLYDNGSSWVEVGLSESQISLGSLGSLDAGGNTLTNLGSPSNNSDAVTKKYADALEQGLVIKDSVRVASQADVDLSSSTDPNPVDGVTLSDGDRVLLKDQTSASENGVYVANTASDPSTWTRSSDADEDSEVTSGMFTFVEEGVESGNESYILITDDPITVGSTALDFTVFSRAGEVVGGDGLVKSGNTLDVRLDVDDDGVDVTDAYGIDFGGSHFDVTDDTDNTVTVSLTNDSVSVAGNSVSLGGSTSVEVNDLTDVDVEAINADTSGNLPAAGTSGRIFFETDTGRTLYDNGTSWVEIGLSESQISLANLSSRSHSDLSDAPSSAHHTRPSAGTALSEDGSNNFNFVQTLSQGGSSVITGPTDIDFGSDFSVVDDTDGSASISLSSNSLTVAGNSVSIGGSTDVSVDDLSDVASSGESAGETLLWDATNSEFVNAAINAGTALSSTSGDGSFTVDVNVGSYLSTDGSGNLQVNLGTGVEGDGSDNVRVDEDASLTWTSQQTFNSGINLSDSQIQNDASESFEFNQSSIEIQNGNYVTLGTIPVPANHQVKVYTAGVNPSGTTGLNVVLRNTTDGVDVYSNNAGYDTGVPLASGAAGDTVEIRLENDTGSVQTVNGFMKVEVVPV